uniref:Uncharacterized protein n=1 Tax=Anguilla anguilla TaxID=7936 RepID=A0A0E9U9E9_ANGAN
MIYTLTNCTAQPMLTQMGLVQTIKLPNLVGF